MLLCLNNLVVLKGYSHFLFAAAQLPTECVEVGIDGAVCSLA